MKEIEEDSASIAKFMGYKYYPFGNPEGHEPGWWKIQMPDILKGNTGIARKQIGNFFLCRRHPELRYYNSWDWLMPVVEKIAEMELNENIEEYFDKEADYNIAIFRESKEITYYAVIHFIKWYNENK